MTKSTGENMKLRNLKNVDEAILRFEPANQERNLATPGQAGLDFKLFHNLVTDHITSLQTINSKLGNAPDLVKKLNQLKLAYSKIFGAPIVDSENLLAEVYQDRVQLVADAIINKSKTNPVKKEELAGMIEREAMLNHVSELGFKGKQSTAWPDFVKDVLQALKGHVVFDRGQAAAKAKRDQQKQLLGKISQMIHDAIGYTFPDGDPTDYLIPRMTKIGIDRYDAMDWLDRAARLDGHKDYHSMLADFWDQFKGDNPELAKDYGMGDNPWNESMVPGDVLMLEGFKEAVVGTVLSFENDTIIIEGAAYPLNEQEARTHYHDFEITPDEFDTLTKDGRLKKWKHSYNPSTHNLRVYASSTRSASDLAKIGLNEAEYQGREVKLGKPMAGDIKKFKVYVKDPKTGNVKKVNFGDKNMEIKRDDPERRKSFRARHGCGTPRASDRTKAAYWSCRLWSNKKVSDILKGK